MDDMELTMKLEGLMTETAELCEEYKGICEELIEKERTALLVVAAGLSARLTNKEAKAFLEAIPKPTVAEKEKIVEMELGDLGHRKAVLEFKLKLLAKESGSVENLTIHAASLRKNGNLHGNFQP
jgi:hypothetical protein